MNVSVSCDGNKGRVLKVLKSVRGVTNAGARDQVVKPVLQCLLSGQMT